MQDIKNFEASISPDLASIIKEMDTRETWTLDPGSPEYKKILQYLKSDIVSKYSQLTLETLAWLPAMPAISLLSALSDSNPEIFNDIDKQSDDELIGVDLQRIACIERSNLILKVINPKAIASTYKGIREYIDLYEEE